MKADNYGDIVSFLTGRPCIGYVEFGSYQGGWVALIDAGETVDLWKGYYGSCSGCDFIEAEKDFDTDEISDEVVRKTFKEDRSFLEIPKSVIETMTFEQFREIFPANIRDDIYGYEDDEINLFNALKNCVKKGSDDATENLS